MTSRRSVLKMMAFAAGGAMLGQGRFAWAEPRFLSHRPPLAKRKFVSPAVEALMARTKAKIGDPELAWMFENCFANTLDTTVQLGNLRGKPDTFIVTGDIDAMWLRDSSAQVWPYVSLAVHDKPLQQLFRGLIRRHALCISIDPYANAFLPDPQGKTTLEWAKNDLTDMRPGVAERKWEIDSLCYPIRLAHAYWRATGDKQPFDDDWREAMRNVLATFREQQRKHGPGSYHFQRRSEAPTESLALGGYGNPARPVGLIHSMFRPSDDACLYPLFIPGNLFAVSVMRQLAQMTQSLFDDRAFADECNALADEIEQALLAHGIIHDEHGGEIWAYEVDGYGNQLFMDDANAPGLSSLAYLGCCEHDDTRYLRTRAAAWSARNPYFFNGRAAQGIGGPHEGLRMIWPMSIIMRGLTGEGAQVSQCLQWLKTTHAGTGFMHEAFDQDDPTHFTRAWFAWANTLFGELIVQLAEHQPKLLQRS
ncbi:glycoside hydrolase family 125 protein [Dyella tabacisoli]|uniref:Glycoside hydrolase family 125 protein n=1 Tax=Dyella tabacisoli TaxID=2282381 RepID=A0A369UM27_9GAMM|nr:glycoside hydrolase family 125 protein [Dyella tabacisoli]RDD81393.1 glycoside hydrolase family 125 protein [Dyella tabacisoli]